MRVTLKTAEVFYPHTWEVFVKYNYSLCVLLCVCVCLSCMCMSMCTDTCIFLCLLRVEAVIDPVILSYLPTPAHSSLGENPQGANKLARGHKDVRRLQKRQGKNSSHALLWK